MAIDLGKYVPRFRRFEHHTLKEVLLLWVLPNDWDELVHLSEVDHEPFDLSETDLYDPARNQPHQRGAILGFIVANGTLWPGIGAVRTRDGKLVKESFFDETSRALALKRGYVNGFPIKRAEVPAATLGHFYRNYYHRWADSIPRIYALHHPRLRALPRIELYIDGRFAPTEREVVRALVPDNVVVRIVNSATRICAPQCIHLPYLSSDRVEHSKWFTASAGFLPQECLNWLRESVYAHFDLTPVQPFRKLYVTRRYAKVRRLINEAEVSQHLESKGFETVALEKRPFREQVKLFAEAEMVVAQHGAGLINLLFAQDVRVLEVCSDRDRQIFFRLLSKAREFPHHQIHRDGTNKNADVTLPVKLLDESLSRLCEAGQPTA